MLIGQAREAVANDVGAQEARELTSELQQVAQALASARASQPVPPSAEGADVNDDDVVDAEFDRS
jgi:molecular chaperone DnaK